MGSSLSIVILAYNEEEYLSACLDAIAGQTQPPDEVIVVNNNSTDRSVEIAERYPFVTVIHEKQQGMIPARNAGFAKARGDILARIDADTVLEPDWCERVRSNFADMPDVGLTGPGYMQAVPLFGRKTTFWSRSYNLGALSDFRFYVLWGGNMAIRARVWPEVLPYLAKHDNEVHEDQDISSALNMLGHTIRFDSNLLVTVDATRFWSMRKLVEYYMRSVKTRLRWSKVRARHGKRRHPQIRPLKAWVFRLINAPVAIVFLLIAGFYSLIKLFIKG